MSEESRHDFTDDLICPYCDKVFSDAWEFGDIGTIECSNCGNTLEYERNTEVTYSSWCLPETSSNGDGSESAEAPDVQK